MVASCRLLCWVQRRSVRSTVSTAPRLRLAVARSEAGTTVCGCSGLWARSLRSGRRACAPVHDALPDSYRCISAGLPWGSVAYGPTAAPATEIWSCLDALVAQQAARSSSPGACSSSSESCFRPGTPDGGIRLQPHLPKRTRQPHRHHSQNPICYVTPISTRRCVMLRGSAWNGGDHVQRPRVRYKNQMIDT